MLGFLVSYKTLNGQRTENRRYPSMDLLRNLIWEVKVHGDVLPMIHYNSRERETLPEQITEVFETMYGFNYCRAVQLNIPWPDPRSIEAIRKKYPDMAMVLQLSRSTMEGKSVEEICSQAADYRDLMQYALIDPSGGAGKEFDLEHSLAVYQGLREHCPQFMIGFAGGLHGGNVEERMNALSSHVGRDFCIDAEGGLRDKVTDRYGDDVYSEEKVAAYVDAAKNAFLADTDTKH